MSLTTNDGPQPPPGALRAWVAVHHCPACGSLNVRRSTIRSREAGAHAWRSPYRCRACKERFWVLSRRARTLTFAGIVAAFAAVMVIAFVIVAPPEDDSATLPMDPTTEEIQVLRPAPARDAASKPASAQQASPKGIPATPSSANAPPAPVPGGRAAVRDESPLPAAGSEKPLRPPAQPFVK